MTQKSGCAVAPWSALSNCSKFVPPLTTDHNFLYSPTPPSPSTSFSLISVIVHLILQSLLFTVHVSKPSQSTLKWLVSFPQFSNYCTFLNFFQSTFSYFCSCVCLLLTVFPLMEIQLLNILLVVFCYCRSSRLSARKVLRPSRFVNSPRKPLKDPIHRYFYRIMNFSYKKYLLQTYLN